MDSPIITKVCKICNTHKPLDAFSITNRKRQLRRRECKSCFNEKRAKLRSAFSTPTQLQISEFWKHVIKTDYCWLWRGATAKNGYGHFSVGFFSVLAHRFSALLVNPTLPKTTLVRHKCDNPPCVNPDHFQYGTHADNSRDMVERGRSKKGRTHWNVKLTELDIVTIRERVGSGEAQRNLAAEYKVSQPTISEIVTRRTWAHLE